ncbi:MAG: hypothetical protein BWY11_02311 [Firmicutes bacterium ADurb.Bin182]|nr:MAG: hypothetical protein BWY11_02311 [Firmicutes bacterium ADurb.Bin182]
MKIKRSLFAVLIPVLVLALAACSSGPDMSELTDAYNKLNETYSEIVSIAIENGWDQKEGALESLDSAKESASFVEDMLENPDQYSQEQVDEFTAQVNIIAESIEGFRDTFSEPCPLG